MSTIILKKPYNGYSAGAKISVPFGVGLNLVRDEIGVYPEQPVQQVSVMPEVSSPAERHAAEIGRLNQSHAAAVKDLKEHHAQELVKIDKAHAAELSKLQAELDAANKTITDLQTKPKK